MRPRSGGRRSVGDVEAQSLQGAFDVADRVDGEEPDALEHEGLWSEPTSSTGCEVMRSPGLHGK